MCPKLTLTLFTIRTENAEHTTLRCLLRTEECWTHNLLYTVYVLIISICATWFISLLECHLSCYILWWCQMITLMSTWYANKYLAFSFLTIFIFYLPGKHGKPFLAGQIPKSFKKKFGKRQLFQTYKQRVQIDIAVNFI